MGLYNLLSAFGRTMDFQFFSYNYLHFPLVSDDCHYSQYRHKSESIAGHDTVLPVLSFPIQYYILLD